MKKLSTVAIIKNITNETNVKQKSKPIKLERETNILLGNHIFKILYKKINDKKAKITDIQIHKVSDGVGDMDFSLAISKNFIKNAVKEDLKNCSKVTLNSKAVKILDNLNIPEYLEHLDKV